MFGLTLPSIPFLPFLSGGRTQVVPDPIVLSRDQVDEIGRELDALRERTVASLGAQDREYIYRIIKAQRGFEVAGRGLLFLGFFLRRGWQASRRSACRRSSTTWKSATTSCTANTIGCASRR